MSDKPHPSDDKKIELNSGTVNAKSNSADSQVTATSDQPLATDKTLAKMHAEENASPNNRNKVEIKENVSPTASQQSEVISPTQNDDEPAAHAVNEPEPLREQVEIDETPTDSELLDTKNKNIATPAKSAKGLWILGAFIVIGWGATGAAGYWGYKKSLQYQDLSVQSQSALSTLKTQIESQLSQSQQSQADTLKELKQQLNSDLSATDRETNTKILKLAQQIEEQGARLNGQQERLTNLSTTSREDWLLAEAEYLLKLANQRVLMERTPDNAVALLTRADTIIQQVAAGLGDRELFAIRKLLAEEITQLKLIKPADTQGIYLQLGALATAINTLPTLPTHEERFKTEEAMVPKIETQWASFKREMSNVFSFIYNSFSMRSEDELANPIVTQQRLQLMQLNTRLLLEQAQISLLKEDTVSFQESLKAASLLTNQYFFESPTRAKFAEEIIGLAQLDIAPTLPDISKSLRLLHSYIADQHRLNAPSAGQISNSNAGAK